MKNYQETKDILRVQGVKAKGYGIIPKLVMQDKRLSIESKAIYSYFCSYAGNGDTAFPSINKICADLCISDERFRKHFKSLKDYGYITVEQAKEKGKFSHNIYTLIDKPTPKTPYPEITSTGNSSTVKPNSEKPTTNNNNVFKNNTSKINMEKNNTHINTQSEQESKKPVCVYATTKDNISLNIPPKDVVSNLQSKVKTNAKSHIVDHSDPMIDKIEFSDLQMRIKNVTGYQILENKLKELIEQKSVERITYHLQNWHIHKKHQKYEGAGWFITVVACDIEPEELEKKYSCQNKIPNRDNFEQREYSDEFLNSFYANLQE